MSEKVINFKEAIKVKNQKKVAELKKEYYRYLEIHKAENEIDEMFLDDFEEEIKAISIEEGFSIKQLMEKWKREYKNNLQNTNSKLLKEIQKEIEEQCNMGYDEETILKLINAKFSKNIPGNISKKEFLNKILDDFFKDYDRQ